MPYKFLFSGIIIVCISFVSGAVYANIANPEFNSSLCNQREVEHICMFNGYAMTFYDDLDFLNANSPDPTVCASIHSEENRSIVQCATIQGCKAKYSEDRYRHVADYMEPTRTESSGEAAGMIRYCEQTGITSARFLSQREVLIVLLVILPVIGIASVVGYKSTHRKTV